MTLVVEPSQVIEPTPSSGVTQSELVGALELLLQGYLDQLNAEHPQWSQDETNLVRTIRDLLVRAGRPPQLSYDVLNHIDSPYANKPVSQQTL